MQDNDRTPSPLHAQLIYLDPAKVDTSQFWVRDPDRVAGGIDALKTSIQLHHGNVTPILVRRATQGGDFEFELVFGHRRHRACLELGVHILAAVRDSMTDTEAIMAADAENRERSDPSALELGMHFTRLLRHGRFTSKRQLADSLGLSHTWVNQCMALAGLPAEVHAAFDDPHVVPAAAGPRLSRALDTDAIGVLERADLLARNPGVIPQPSVSKTVAFLAGESLETDAWRPLCATDPDMGEWRSTKKAALEIRALTLSQATLLAIGEIFKASLGVTELYPE